MTDLSEFLLARIAEDAGAARRVPPFSHRDVVTELPFGPTRAHIAAWDPARVLAECEAKRRRVKALNDRAPHPNAVPLLRKLLALEALPYADHPDYREEWRP